MSRAKSLDDNQAGRARRAYEAGADLKTLGERFDVSPGTVRRAIIRAGGTIRDRSGMRMSDEELDERVADALAHGVACYAIAHALGVSYSRVKESAERVEALWSPEEDEEELSEYELELLEEEERRAQDAAAEGVAFDAYLERVREERYGY